MPSSVSATPPVIEIYFLIGNDSTPRKLSPLFISASPIGGELGTSFHPFWPSGHLLSIHSEAFTPLDVPGLHTSLPESHDPGLTPLYPALATASLSNITVGFPPFHSLQCSVDRLAPYCSSACNLLLFSPYWGFVWPLTYLSAALGSYQSAGFAHHPPCPGLQDAVPPWALTSGLHPTAPRLATYCPSLHTGASLCLLHTPRQHWVPTSLRALPTSLPTQGSNMPRLLRPSP